MHPQNMLIFTDLVLFGLPDTDTFEMRPNHPDEVEEAQDTQSASHIAALPFVLGRFIDL